MEGNMTSRDKQLLKNRQYSAKYRAKILANEETAKIYRAKNAEKCKRYRHRMKQQALEQANQMKEKQQAPKRNNPKKTQQKKEYTGGYKYKKCLENAVNRVEKTLPEDPAERREIIDYLMKLYNVSV